MNVYEEHVYLKAIRDRLVAELEKAEAKALDALARYKFEMFGYWAAAWVRTNRLLGEKRPNPFRELVKHARRIREGIPESISIIDLDLDRLLKDLGGTDEDSTGEPPRETADLD